MYDVRPRPERGDGVKPAGGRPPRESAWGWGPHAQEIMLAAAYFALLAVALSWPLAQHLGTHVPGAGPGDNLSFLWNFWWARQAFSLPDGSLFYTSYLFAPFGAPLVLHTHTAMPAVLGATLLVWLPVVAAHNIVLLGGLAANGWCTYALAMHEVRRFSAAIVAGSVFATAAFVSIRLLGHFNLVHAWVVPLSLWCWIRTIEQPSVARGVTAGAALAAALYTDYYLFIFADISCGLLLLLRQRDLRVEGLRRLPRWLSRSFLALVAIAVTVTAAILMTGGFRIETGGLRISASQIRNPVAALWIVLLLWLLLKLRVSMPKREDALPLNAELRILAVGALTWIVLSAPLLYAAASAIAAGDYSAPPVMWRSGPSGADLLTLVAGNPLNTITSGFTASLYEAAGIDRMEQVAWLGVVPMAAILIAALSGRLRDRLALRWWVVGGVWFIWARGGYLSIAGYETPLPLPQAIARLVPILSNARIPGRAIVMVQLAAALLAALAVVRLQWRTRVVALLAALAVADGLAAPIPLYELPRPDAVDAALTNADRSAIVVELPTGMRDGFGETGRFDHRALAHQIAHGHPLAGGFVARLSPTVREQLDSSLALVALSQFSRSGDGSAGAELPDGIAYELISLGIAYVVVNQDVMGAEVGPILEARGLRLLVQTETRALYAVGGGN